PVVGPYGASESMLFTVLSGAFPSSEGIFDVEGKEITGLEQSRFAHVGIAKSFQITNLFPQLSVHENVRVAAQAIRAPFNIWSPRASLTELSDKADALLALVGLAERRNEAAENLAHGEQRALEIAVALSCDPRLLLLDEPTAGMSPEE